MAREFSPTRNAARYIYNQEVKESKLKCKGEGRNRQKLECHVMKKEEEEERR